jgi:type I restriction enzyme S subunit
MSSSILLSIAAKYSEDRINGSKVSRDCFVTTDSMIQNKGGITNTPVLPKGNLIAFSKGDILIGNIRPYLQKIWYSDKNGGCSPDVLVIQAMSNTDSKFLYYSLFRDDFFNHMMNGSKGTKMPRGDKSQILRFHIPKIELSTQQKIASVLSVLDSKIELNNRINAELEAMAKTLYDYWFVQFEFPDKNGKPYKTSGGKMVWSEELKREIPEGWKIGTLLDIANYENGLPCQKFRPNGAGFLRVIKIREMNEGFSSNTELVRTDIPAKAIIENGDVLFSWSASLDVKIWTGGKGALNQHIFKVTSNDYPKSFYFYQLLNYLQHFKMMAENRKTTMGHITQEHLKQSRIAIPPIQFTLELEKIIAPLFSKKVINEIENQKLTELRDWLLPMLMNGQVKVN